MEILHFSRLTETECGYVSNVCSIAQEQKLCVQFLVSALNTSNRVFVFLPSVVGVGIS